MSEEIVFYHNPISRSAMVHGALEEFGVPYRIADIDFASGASRQPAFLKINPMGKIPAIEHRGTIVTEGAAIMAYLADAFPEKGLAPSPTSPERGTYLRWLFFTAGCFEPAFLDTMMKRPPVPNKAACGYGSYEDVLAAIEIALTPGPWILGDSFSAADLYLGAELGFATKFGSPGLADSAIISDYVARFNARPAIARAAAADQAAIAERQTAGG